MSDKPFVRVRWVDACDEEKTWVPASEIDAFTADPCEVISYGWLVSETKKYLTLAADFIPGTETYGRITKIPKAWAKVEKVKT